MKPKFCMGDTVWAASFQARQESVVCPDCGGTLKLKVTLFDGTEYIIDCQTCAHGYDPPRGYIFIWKAKATACQVTLGGLEIRQGSPVEYRESLGSSCGRIYQEEDLFLTEEEALIRAEEKRLAYEADEEKRFQAKLKPTRKWAWHVTYHRRELKRAEADAEHHARKLGIAKKKAKEK